MQHLKSKTSDTMRLSIGGKGMKIVKRDGKIVEYDSDKIRIAIGKANAEVAENQRIDEKQTESIIKYIEG